MSIRDEMQSLMNKMAVAYRAADAAGCAALFARDAELHSPFGPPALGREAIEALHRDWAATKNDKQIKVLDAGSSDDLAWCLAAYSEGEVTGEGTSLSICERGDGQKWSIRVCCLHDNFEQPAD